MNATTNVVETVLTRRRILRKKRRPIKTKDVFTQNSSLCRTFPRSFLVTYCITSHASLQTNFPRFYREFSGNVVVPIQFPSTLFFYNETMRERCIAVLVL